TTVTATVTTSSPATTATCSFTVTVKDNEPPTVTCPTPENPYSNDPGKCFASLTFEVEAEDNCGVGSMVYKVASNTISFPYEFPVGSTTVLATVTDIHGNTKTCSFTVVVEDSEAPTVTCPTPDNPYTGECYAELTFEVEDASDNCDIASTTFFVEDEEIEFPYNFPGGITTVVVVVT
ncbi:MAG: HYR domain-containing protein, partial [Saprospiraceae bacterium]|nr:HYR domain-containing protein [Saprospiraceae bacterium]